MSARTAQYLRVMLTPQNPDGSEADVHPSIAGLNHYARHLAEVLSNLAYHHDNSRTIPVPVLARRMDVSDRTVQRAIKDLTAAGVIKVDRGGQHRDDPSTYRFPLAAPVELVPRGDQTVTPDASTGVTEPTPRGDCPVTHKILQDPLVTDTYAVQRGAEPWRAIIERATAADDARRAGGT